MIKVAWPSTQKFIKGLNKVGHENGTGAVLGNGATCQD